MLNFIELLMTAMKRIAPGFFSDPAYDSVFIFLFFTLVISAGSYGFVYVLRFIKNPRDRARALILAGVFIMNLILLVLWLLESVPFKETHNLLRFLIPNLICYGIYRYVLLVMPKKRTSPIRDDRDLHLKPSAGRLPGVLPCPSCGLRTISQDHASRFPQTCGECGHRYVVSNLRVVFGAVLMSAWLVETSALIFIAEKHPEQRDHMLLIFFVSIVLFPALILLPPKLKEYK